MTTTPTPLSVTPQQPGPDRGLSWGVRQSWLTGETDEGYEFELTSGAGLGTPWLILTIDTDEVSVREAIDVRNLAEDWLESMIARHGLSRAASEAAGPLAGGTAQGPAEAVQELP